MNKILAQTIMKLCLVNGFSLCGTAALAAETPPIDPPPAPTLTWENDIQPIVTDNCAVCHSGTDPSGDITLETKDQVLKLKINIIKVVTAGEMPLGNPDFATSDDGKKFLTWLQAQPDPVTFDKDIKPIITANCQKCHTKTKASGGFAFDTEAQVVAARKKISSEVSSGSMPKGNKTFKNSAEAKRLLDWIKSLDTTPAS